MTEITDTQRLDWLEQHPEFYLRKHKKHWAYVPLTSSEYFIFPKLREAIDAAINDEWRAE